MLVSQHPSYLKINSKIENVRVVEPFLKDFFNTHNLDRSTYGDMLLVLTEAVTNSIKHGNALDPNKKVTIQLQKHQCGKRSGGESDQVTGDRYRFLDPFCR